MTELMPSLCNDCVARNQCGNDDVKMCISYTKETKIKCDDCKFVENCVDYGWKECKKFTPKPSEPMTNEEWLKSRSNKELANAIFSAFVESATMIGCCVTLEYFRTQMELIDALREWLKQPHREENEK